MDRDRAPASALFAWALGLGLLGVPVLALAVDDVALAPGTDAIRVDAARAAPSPLLAIDQNRGTVVDRVVADWGDALAKANVGLSHEQLRTMLVAMRADHLFAASLAGSLDGLRNVIAGAIVSSAPAATDLFQGKSLGDTGSDLVYTPITPCRLVDTRGTFAAVYQGDGTAAHNPSPFAPAQVRNYAAQGGNGACTSQLPAGLNPSALQVQVFGLPVNAASSGDIEILPQGSAFGSTATLVYLGNVPVTSASATTRLNLANNQVGVQVRGGGAHVAIDVLGYFKAPGAPIGTVSNIATGTGLTGGPITTTGTISIASGGVGATQLAAKSVTQAKLSPAASPTAGQVLGSDGTNLQWQTVSGGGGGVSAVTASAPLASSGGTTPNISMTGGAAGQVLVGTGSAPAWVSSPTFAGNLYVQGGSLLNPNVGIGWNDPQAIVHIMQSTNSFPPRVESTSSGGFGAGWDFYLNGGAKGYVGVPDPSAAPGGGEMMVFGTTSTPTSLWGGNTRALTISGDGTGNVGIGVSPGNITKVRVVGDDSAIRADANSVAIRAYGGDTGIYGESSTANLNVAGVYGRNTANGGIGVTGQANAGTATGVFGTTSSPSGFGMYAQNSGGGRALFVDGAATQGLPFSGLVKAMLHIGTNGAIGACYNGITGSSTIPCGFSVSHPSVSHYTINLGFSMAGRYPLFQPNFPDVAQVVITGFPANGISVTTVSGNPWSLTDLDFFLYIF